METTPYVDRKRVYEALDSERAYQDDKAIQVSGKPHRHELEAYVLYMEDYLHELRNQMSRIWVKEGVPPEALNTLRKVTALGVAAMEAHGAPRREGF